MIFAGTGTRLRVHLRERRAARATRRPTSSAGSPPTRRSPTTCGCTRTARTLTASYSYDGAARSRPSAGRRRSARSAQPAGSGRSRCPTRRRRVPVAHFDWIRFDPDGPGGGGGGGSDVDDFDGTTLGAAVGRRPPDQALDRQRRHAAHPGRSRATSTRPATTRRTWSLRAGSDRALDRDHEGQLRGHRPSTTRPGSSSTATTTTSRSSAASRTRRPATRSSSSSTSQRGRRATRRPTRPRTSRRGFPNDY